MRGEDRFATIADPDIQTVTAGEDGGTFSVSGDVLCITHPAVADLTLGSVGLVVNGQPVTLGEIGSGAAYEARRVSTTQTVLKRTTGAVGAATVTIGHSGIGYWTIGLDFVVS